MLKEDGKSFIVYNIDFNNDVVIEDLYVDPSDRGKHKGYKLIDMAVEYAEEHSIDIVSLCACPQDDSITDEALINYYRNYGFSSTGCDELMEYEV